VVRLHIANNGLDEERKKKKPRADHYWLFCFFFVCLLVGRVILNVGGNRFDTSVATLVKDQNSMLAAMFSGRYRMKVEEDGSYFIDRDGSHFRYVLNYLRDNTVSLPPNRQIHLELLREANFYQLVGLVEHTKSSLKRLEQVLGAPSGDTKDKGESGKKAAKTAKQLI